MAVGELHVSVALFARHVVYFETGRGGAEQGFCTSHVGQHDGCTAGVVAWGGFLLLVAVLVLFVNDDEPQVAERQEDAGAHAEYELVGAGGCLPLVDVEALCFGEF